MDWIVIAALTCLAVAMAVGLVVAMYASVSRYAKRLDPAQRPQGEAPHNEGDGG